MINTYLQIVQGLSTEFTHLKDNTLYLFTDTKQIFLGKEEYMSNLSKETFEDLINSIIQTQLPAEISSLE